MKAFKIAAAIIAASISAFTIAPAFAQGDASQGHYEWQQAPQYGPRAPLQAPQARLGVGCHADGGLQLRHDEDEQRGRRLHEGDAGHGVSFGRVQLGSGPGWSGSS